MSIETIINTWDPIELFPHSPPDEYSVEIQKIALAKEQTDDAIVLGNNIYQIFIDSFGREIFQKPLSECVTIAQEIIYIS